MANDRIKFVAWFDEDYRESQLLGMSVIAPKDIVKYEFDCLLVASFDQQIKDQVEHLFAQFDLPITKIRYITIDTTKFADYINAIGFDAFTFSSLPLEIQT
jgi:hypothetical protein